MSQPRAVTRLCHPQEFKVLIIKGTSSSKQFTQAIIYFSLCWLSGLPWSDSTTFCWNDFLNYAQIPTLRLSDCELVERVLWSWCSAFTAVRGAKLLSSTNGESKLLPWSAVSCRTRRGVKEMMVEVKSKLMGIEIPLYSYRLFRV